MFEKKSEIAAGGGNIETEVQRYNGADLQFAVHRSSAAKIYDAI